MAARQLTLEDCQAVADLETQLFDGRFDAAGLRGLLGKPAFYGAYLAADANNHPRLLSGLYYTMRADIIAIGTEKTMQGQGFGQIILQHLIQVSAA